MKRKQSAGDGHGDDPEYYHCKHEIFVSHSGAQKGFVTDLVESLDSLSYSVFFDQKHHSLPPGRCFPPLIFSAAKTCYVALIVLSEEFVTSRWPMMELCFFADRLKEPYASTSSTAAQLSLLPLFFKLLPEEIKKEDKLKEWRKKWKEFEDLDRSRMSADKCEEAVTKLLSRFSGVIRRPEREQGEKSYIETVVEAIFDVHRPSNLDGAVDPNMYVGAERLCQDILGKFPKLQQNPGSSSSNSQVGNAYVSILGMYGLPGSGKSTICNLIRACPSVFREFKQNVVILDLPTIFNSTGGTNDDPVTQQLAKLLSKFDPQKGRSYFSNMNVKELYGLLRNPRRMRSHKMFVVVDNICASNYEGYQEMVLEILCSRIVGFGSKVMLVSQSRTVLENLKKELDFKSRAPEHYEYAITVVPCLTQDEAIELMRHQYSISSDRTTSNSAKEEVVMDLLRESSFQSSFMYIPMVFKLIGVFLRENDDANVADLCKMVKEGKKNVVQELVGKNFEQLREDLRDLFLDIALFIIPAGFSALVKDVVLILCKMHNISESELRYTKLMELQKHCLLSLSSEKTKSMTQIQIHDIFMEYARRIHGHSKYINEIFDPQRPGPLPTVFSGVRKQHGKNWLSSLQILETRSRSSTQWRAMCSEARTIIIEFPSIDDRDVPTATRELSLDLEIGPKTQALLVRNHSPAPNSMVRLFLSGTGDLSSLLFLKLVNVHYTPEISAETKLAWFEWENDDIKIEETIASSDRERPQNTSGWLGLINGAGHQVQRSLQQPLMKLKGFLQGKIATSLPLLCREQNLYYSDQFLRNYVVSSPCLTVLKLTNIHIQRIDLKEIGGGCPQLEALEVVDEAHELMSVNVGNAPNLKRLLIGSMFRKLIYGSTLIKGRYDNPGIDAPNSSNLVLRLQECPQLQQFQVDVSLFDEVEVDVGLSGTHEYPIAMKLITSCKNHLLLLETLEMTCTKVERIDLTPFRLPILKSMIVSYGTNLTHLIIGPGSLPNLHRLVISDCDKLQVIEGLQNVVIEKLDWLVLLHLPELQCHTHLSSNLDLMLEGITVMDCPDLMIDSNILAASKNIQSIVLNNTGVVLAPGHAHSEAILLNAIVSMKDSLRALRLGNVCLHYVEDEDITIRTSIVVDMDGSENMQLDEQPVGEQVVVDEGKILQWPHPGVSLQRSRFVVPSSFVGNLKVLALSTGTQQQQLQLLQEIDSIQHFHNLQELTLSNLKSLTRISGKCWPTRITTIIIDDCPELQRILPLQHTPHLQMLRFYECIKLEAVEGDFSHMRAQLESVDFSKCESMAVFPMKDVMEELRSRQRTENYYMKRRNEADLYEPRLVVEGSKFASVEVMQGWLRDAEFGSALFEAALRGLISECAREEGSSKT